MTENTSAEPKTNANPNVRSTQMVTPKVIVTVAPTGGMASKKAES
jgi:hypothetical protein